MGGGKDDDALDNVVSIDFRMGNATSLPPLIAQVEFVKDDVARVVPLIVAISQGTCAFSPATFGLSASSPSEAERLQAVLRPTSLSLRQQSRELQSPHSCSGASASANTKEKSRTKHKRGKRCP